MTYLPFSTTSLPLALPLLTLLVGSAFWATDAEAQPMPCADRQQVVSQLQQRYAENRTAFGLSANGGLLEVFASPSGSWSILLTMPRGPTCLVASGSDWSESPEAPGVSDPDV